MTLDSFLLISLRQTERASTTPTANATTRRTRPELLANHIQPNGYLDASTHQYKHEARAK
jgi:hypothetical protein